MLQSLSIRNIVLIRQCDIDFAEGLCVLTGETGAGKSILLDALGLVLGGRSETRLIRHGEASASVMAEFNIRKNEAAKTALRELELDADDMLLLRRTLSTDGKTSCFINDQKVGVGALRQVGETLVEIHGQHDQRGLMDGSTHLDLLDAYGKLESPRSKTAQAYQAWREAESALDALRAAAAQARQEEEYLQFMVNELSQLSPEPGEESELAERRTNMMGAEKLAETLNDILKELQGSKSVEESLRNAQRMLSRSTATQGESYTLVGEQLERAMVEVQEAIAGLERIGRESAYNPHELERIEERLFALRAAARKYNMTVDELTALLEQAQQKLATISHQDKAEKELLATLAQAKQRYQQAADTLSKARKKTATSLEKEVMKELAPLKMSDTLFRVRCDALPEQNWSARGQDQVQFETVTNAVKGNGAAFASLNRIASGGELSRFMLALKVALAQVKSTPTLIFDEIDTGIGGAVADAVGQRLALLGEELQVLAVTHLPQVAARGDMHLRVSKASQKTGVETTVERLATKDRKEELARMLAGAEVTAEARKAAGKLLEAAG